MNNDKIWIGDLLGGSLMRKESRIIAELMLTDPDENSWQQQVIGQNILQTSSANTSETIRNNGSIALNDAGQARMETGCSR